MNLPPFLAAALTATPLQLVPAMTQTGNLASGQAGTPKFLSAERMNLAYQNLNNPNSAGVFLQYFDAASVGAVVLGTTKPLASFSIPGTQSGGGSGVLSESYDPGIMLSFKLGVVVAVTTTQQGAVAPGAACQLMAQFV
jgi:hypothetical protein